MLKCYIFLAFNLRPTVFPLSKTFSSIDDIFSLCCEAGYDLYSQPPNYGRGGGIGISLYMDLPTPSISSFN